MHIEEILEIFNRSDELSLKGKGAKMRFKFGECSDFIRTELSQRLAASDSILANSVLTNGLKVPIWYMAVSKLDMFEGAKTIEDMLHINIKDKEYRSVAYSRKKLINILLTGIDVMPSTSIFYSGSLAKSLRYGGFPKIVLILDSTKLKPTLINLGQNASLEKIKKLAEIYPYSKTDKVGNFWMSRNNVEQRRFGPEERAYAHWIPGESREALLGILILRDGIDESDDEELLDRYLYNMLLFDE